MDIQKQPIRTGWQALARQNAGRKPKRSKYPTLRCPYCRQLRPSYLYKAHVDQCESLR